MPFVSHTENGVAHRIYVDDPGSPESVAVGVASWRLTHDAHQQSMAKEKLAIRRRRNEALDKGVKALLDQKE